MKSPHIGNNIDGFSDRLTQPHFRQPPGAAPAQPQRIEKQPPPARRCKRAEKVRPARQLSPDRKRLQRVPAQFGQDFHVHGPIPVSRVERNLHAFLSALSPRGRRQTRRDVNRDAQPFPGQSHGQICGKQHQYGHRIQQRETPCLGAQGEYQQSQRSGNGKNQHKAQGRQKASAHPARSGGIALHLRPVFHRGAAV